MSNLPQYSNRVIGLVWASWIAIQLPRMVIPALLPAIAPAFRISLAEAGLLMTSYFCPYALMQIPIGALSDRFGRKSFIIVSLVGSSLASLAILGAQTFMELIILRVVAGFFAGLWFAPSMSLMTRYVRENRRDRAFGIVFSASNAADVVIFLMVGVLGLEAFEWRNYFLIYAIPGLLCASLTWLSIKDLTSEVPESMTKLKEDATRVLSDPLVVGIMVCSATVGLIIYSFASFLPIYFVQARGLAASDAALLMMAYAVPTLLSGPVAGHVAARLGYRLSFVCYFALLILVVLGLPTMPMGMPIVAVLIIYGLIRTWSSTNFNTLITRIVPAKTRGTYLGMVNASTFLGAATGPIIFGYAADIGGYGIFFLLALATTFLAILTTYPIFKTSSITRP